MDKKLTLWSKQAINEERQYFQQFSALLQENSGLEGGSQTFQNSSLPCQNREVLPICENLYFHSKLHMNKHRAGIPNIISSTVYVGKPSTRTFEEAMFRLYQATEKSKRCHSSINNRNKIGLR